MRRNWPHCLVPGLTTAMPLIWAIDATYPQAMAIGLGFGFAFGYTFKRLER